VLIDTENSGNRNLIKKGTEQNKKYEELAREIQRVENEKTNVIPVKIWVTGTVSK
jgi:hypothetical protein